MMRKPAELAGLGALQSFLERGYAAFRVMRRGSDFVDIVSGRERAISDAIFAGDDDALSAAPDFWRSHAGMGQPRER